LVGAAPGIGTGPVLQPTGSHHGTGNPGTVSNRTGDVAKNRRGVSISGERQYARHKVLFDGYLKGAPMRGMGSDNLSQVNSPIVRLSASLAAILAESRLACCTPQTHDPEVLKVTPAANGPVGPANRRLCTSLNGGSAQILKGKVLLESHCALSKIHGWVAKILQSLIG